MSDAKAGGSGIALAYGSKKVPSQVIGSADAKATVRSCVNIDGIDFVGLGDGFSLAICPSGLDRKDAVDALRLNSEAVELDNKRCAMQSPRAQ